jgi:hypothetical protein
MLAALCPCCFARRRRREGGGRGEDGDAAPATAPLLDVDDDARALEAELAEEGSHAGGALIALSPRRRGEGGEARNARADLASTAGTGVARTAATAAGGARAAPGETAAGAPATPRAMGAAAPTAAATVAGAERASPAGRAAPPPPAPAAAAAPSRPPEAAAPTPRPRAPAPLRPWSREAASALAATVVDEALIDVTGSGLAELELEDASDPAAAAFASAIRRIAVPPLTLAPVPTVVSKDS